jgi:CBS domain-containing protein
MLTARDVMSPDPVALAPTDTLRFAAGVLTTIDAGGAPVMDDDRVVGFLSVTDIVEFAAEPPPLTKYGAPHGPMAVPESPEWDALDEHTVAEVMSLRILSVAPGASLTEVARLMEGEAVHRLLVMEGDALLGILSALDLVRATARGEYGAS